MMVVIGVCLVCLVIFIVLAVRAPDLPWHD